jgi:hypothetical protein
MSNAAGHLRSGESTCTKDLLGINNAVTKGKHGDTLLGDLATIVCSYDTTAGYSSNSLSSYFHDLGWRDRLNNDVLHTWLFTGKNISQTLGGNYGEATPSDLSYTLTDSNTKTQTCVADKDPWPKVYSNTIAPLTAAELTRRIVLHRDLSSSNYQFPGNHWEDMQSILYGAENSLFFPGQNWGGMTADTAIYLQSTSSLQTLLVNNPTVLSTGDWRIFSKLGAGYSSSGLVGEIISNSYACIPSYGDDGTTIVGGIEFTLAARGSISKDYDLSQVDIRLQKAINNAMAFVVDHY